MLAIVIPYYKLSSFEETLKSLVKQSNQNFVVYIGDDASPESPEKLLNNYTLHLDIVYHKFDVNVGGNSLIQQWNRCINLIGDEEWIMILGDDDYLSEDVVKLFYEQHDTFKIQTNIVRFASQLVYGTDRINSKVYEHPILETAKDSFYRKHKDFTRGSLSEYVFSKKQYLKYKFHNYPLAWFSDDRAWLDFSEDKPIYTINNAKIFIRVSNESISGKRDNLELKSISSSLFYSYLVNNKLNSFTAEEGVEIVKSYIKRILFLRRVLIKKELNFDFIEQEYLQEAFYIKSLLGDLKYSDSHEFVMVFREYLDKIFITINNNSIEDISTISIDDDILEKYNKTIELTLLRYPYNELVKLYKAKLKSKQYKSSLSILYYLIIKFNTLRLPFFKRLVLGAKYAVAFITFFLFSKGEKLITFEI